jgi:hypothetical protein
LTERLITYLRDFRTKSRTRGTAYLDLMYHLRARTEADVALERPEREYLRTLLFGMAAWWLVACDVLDHVAWERPAPRPGP